MDVLDFVLPLSAVLVITLIHFIGERISQHMQKWHHHLQSFGAGLMVGIIFLELLPHIATGQEHLDEFIYIPFLFGFTIIAIVEKIVYKRLIRKQKLEDTKLQLQEEVISLEKGSDVEIITDKESEECISPEQNALFEGVAFIIHGLVIGMLTALIFETYQEIAYIVLIPFLIRAFTLSFSAEQILEEIEYKKSKIIRIFSFLTPTLGAAIGIFLLINKILLYIVFALTIGVILYIVVRDMIPLGKKGKPVYFILGVSLAITIFLIFELVVFA